MYKLAKRLLISAMPLKQVKVKNQVATYIFKTCKSSSPNDAHLTTSSPSQSLEKFAISAASASRHLGER
jgi:hypothetical protein